MKTLKHILFAVIFASLVSCAEEDISPTEGTNDKLVGAWLISSYTLNGDQVMGGTLAYGSLTFTKSSASTGSMKFSYRFSGENTIETETDSYQVIEDGAKLRFGTDEMTVLFTSGLYLAGTVDGDYIAIKAAK